MYASAALGGDSFMHARLHHHRGFRAITKALTAI
jgi:hypothetical protein